MNIQRITELPVEIFGEIVSHLEKRDVGALTRVSKDIAKKCKDIAKKCEKGERGWRSFLPDRYQDVPYPVLVVKDAWTKQHKMENVATVPPPIL